jgi:hypothetical protein
MVVSTSSSWFRSLLRNASATMCPFKVATGVTHTSCKYSVPYIKMHCSSQTTKLFRHFLRLTNLEPSEANAKMHAREMQTGKSLLFALG